MGATPRGLREHHPAQKLGFAAWLVQNVCDLDMPEDSMVDLAVACVALRRQQGVFLKAEKAQS